MSWKQWVDWNYVDCKFSFLVPFNSTPENGLRNQNIINFIRLWSSYFVINLDYRYRSIIKKQTINQSVLLII